MVFLLPSCFSRPDIAFAREDTHRFLPWLTGAMVCLAALLLCVCLSINGWVIRQHGQYANSFTVLLPAEANSSADTIANLTKAIGELPNVQNYNRIGDAELKTMLAPWLGSASTVSELPLPVMYDVSLPDDAPPPNYAMIREALERAAPGVTVDAHEQWVAAFAQFSLGLQRFTILLAALVGLSLVVMIAFSSRASLKLHAKTVHLLHAIGAEDSYIARQFQQDAFLIVLPGALFGCALAGLLYAAVGAYLASLPTGAAVPALQFTAGHGVLLLTLPFICAVMAWGIAHLCVRGQMQRTL